MVLDANERECTFSTVLRIDNFENYDFKGDAGHVHYTICAYIVELGFDEVTGQPIPDGQGGQAYTIFKYPMKSGTLPLNDTVVSQWGADDQIIFDYVAQELQLTLV